jgi:hypothetical protein
VGDVGLRVDPAEECAHLAAGDPLDGLAEGPALGVLEEQAQIAQTLMLAHPLQRALGRRERLLERHDERVGARPVRARLRRAAAELLLVEAHHLVGDRAEHVLWRVVLLEAGQFHGHRGSSRHWRPDPTSTPTACACDADFECAACIARSASGEKPCPQPLWR